MWHEKAAATKQRFLNSIYNHLKSLNRSNKLKLQGLKGSALLASGKGVSQTMRFEKQRALQISSFLSGVNDLPNGQRLCSAATKSGAPGAPGGQQEATRKEHLRGSNSLVVPVAFDKARL